MYQLRPYQEDLINKIIKSMKNKKRVIIVQSPPRTGKTVVMAEIARRTTLNKNNTLFIIHRKEILEQAVATFKKQNVDMNYFTGGMVQTLSRHLDKLKTPKLIMIDEGHHALAKSYLKILEKYSHAYVLLFTATPWRLGKQQLDHIADDVIVGKSIKELISEKYLANFKYFSPPNGFNFDELKKSSTGDYTAQSMANADTGTLYGDIVKQYLRLAKGKQAVAYSYSIESAKRIADVFNKKGITAYEVDSNTPTEKRDTIIRKFKAKELMILVNVNLFTEGIDLPDVDCVIMARPTTSLALFLQFSMRCLNPREGKTAIIIDHANNVKKFGLPDDERDWKKAIISHSNKKSKLNTETNSGVAIATCNHCFAVVLVSQVINNICPICGQVMHIPKKKKVIDVDLVEAKKQAIRKAIMVKVANKKVDELKTMYEFASYAKIHGYKPGWAFYMAKKKGIIK